MVRMRPNAADRHSPGRGVRDPTDPAGDRRDSLPRGVTAATAGRGGPAARSMGAEKEVRTMPRHGTMQREREEAPGGAREQQRTRPRVITSPVGAELSPPTRGAHRAPIGRAPCRGNVPASRRDFSFVSAHLRTSLGTLSSCLLSLSLSYLPIVYRFCRDTMCSSLSSSRYTGFHPCPSRTSHLAVLRCSTLSHPCFRFVLLCIPLSFFRRGSRRLPALVRFLNATSGGPARKATIPFRIPTRLIYHDREMEVDDM